MDLALSRLADGAEYLTHDEERALLIAAKGGDHVARGTLVMAHMRLSVSIAKRFRRHGVPVEDLAQEGLLGLLTAVDKFNLRSEARFASYAKPWVHERISDAALKNSRRDAVEISLDAPVTPDDVQSVAMVETMPDDGELPDAAAERLIDGPQISGAIMIALSTLDERERAIAESLLLNEGGETLTAIGKRFGITQERASQIKTTAFAKLRKALNRDGTMRRHRALQAA